MENQTIFNIGLILALIAGFTTIVVYNPNTGEAMEPSHFCESIGIKMYCARTTEFYCYPNNETRTGSKKCSEGWKEIPKVYKIPESISMSNKIICDCKECIWEV